MKTRTVRWVARALLLSMACTILGVITGSGTAAAAIPVYATPGLQQARFINTNPFVGTSIEPYDAEGLAHVPSDHSIWLLDDDAYQLYEIDPDTGVLKRVITQATFAAAVRYGGTETAGNNTASDFEALTYDQVNDVIYVFAGKCCDSSIRAAAFRMLRDSNGVFQVESFQPFTSPMNDFSGMGDVNGEIWAALNKTIYKYTYTTNTFSNGFTVTGTLGGAIVGMGYSSDGDDLWFVTSGNYLYRMNWNTRALVPGHQFDMASHTVLDPRAVEVVGDQLFICDGYDAYPVNSPDRYAIKVYNVVNAGAPVAPVASFTKNVASGVTPLAVQFSDTSTGTPTSWSWDFGDGTAASTTQNPSHTYTTPGTYNVTLTASSANGSNTSPPQTITVTAPAAPVASFTKNVASGVTPLAVQFSDTSTGTPTSWSWDFGDGTAASTTQNPSHTYTTPGTYNVTLTASSANGSNTSPPQTITVTAPAAPVASFTKNVASGVTPLAVQFSDTSTGTPTSWSWDFGDGTAASTTQNPSHTYTTPGTYNVTLTASSANGSNTSPPQTITVTAPATTATFTTTKDAFVNSSSPTKNYGTTYDYLRLLAGASQYSSYVAFDVTGVSATVTNAVLRLYVTDGSNTGGTWYSTASTWNESTITWNNAPAINGTPIATGGPATAGTWIEINVTAAVTGNGSYSFGGQTTSTSSLRYSSKEGTNAPQLVLTFDLGAPAAPVASFTKNVASGVTPLAVQFSDTSTGTPTSWSWDFGDGTAASTTQNPSHTYTTPGTYNVTLTASSANGSNTSPPQTITVTAPATTATFTTTKDAFVNSSSPTKNYGTTYDYLRLLAGASQYSSYVAFDVTGVSATVTNAVLRLYVTDGSNTGGTWYSTASTWNESTITWNNAPAINGTPIATGGPATAGTWIEINVTAAVTGNGSYSFGGQTTSTSSLRYSSKEGTNAPQLVLTLSPS